MRLLAEELAVERGGQPLFSGLSFGLSAGEALALRGSNGAGKTSLLRVLAGLAVPLAGRVLLHGAGGTLGAHCHLLAAENAMKPALTAIENLRFWHRFLAAPEGETGEALIPAAALEAVGLGAVADLPFAALSTGQKRRAGVARLLIRHRPVWLLDEPALGLDDASEAALGHLVGIHLARGGLVVAALHGRPFIAFDHEIRLGGAA